MHPLRRTLHNELHARPSLYFKEPAHVFHAAFIGTHHERQTLLTCIYSHPIEGDLSQGITYMDGYPLKWEHHAEFLTLTYVVAAINDCPRWIALPSALSEKIAPFKHLLINSVQIAVLDEKYWDGSHTEFGFKDPCGSSIGGGDAIVSPEVV